MASLADALKLYTKIAIVGATAGYGYLHHRCKKLKEEANDFDMVQMKKD